MTSEPRQDPPPSDDPATDKARVLLALLGPERLAALRRKGLVGADLGRLDLEETHGPGDAAAQLWQRNRLIQKFRDRGLLPGDTPAGAGLPQTASATSPAAPAPLTSKPRAGLAQRLAENFEEGNLTEEHPAVIAHLLKRQSAAIRSQVLRDLPGAQARAVMRVLRML